MSLARDVQPGALGLVTNAVALWNTLYMQEALNWMCSHGEETGDEDIARLSPLMYGHITMLGHQTFTLPDDIQIERGESSPTATLLARLSGAFDMSMS